MPRTQCVNCIEITDKLLSVLIERGHKLELPVALPKSFYFEDTIHEWLTRGILDYMQKNGMLKTRSDFGDAEQIIAFYSAFVGTYASFHQLHEGLREDFYLDLTEDYTIYNLIPAVLNKMGMNPNSNEYQALFDDIQAIVMASAPYANAVGTAEQIREVCKALYRTGMILELNREGRVHDLCKHQNEVEQIVLSVDRRSIFEDLHVDIENNTYTFIYSFSAQATAHSLFKQLQNFSNIDCQEGMDPESGRGMLKLTVYEF